jgi:hypothetical protein
VGPRLLKDAIFAMLEGVFGLGREYFSNHRLK